MFKKKDGTIVNARKITKMRCIAGLALCATVIVLTMVALLLNSANIYQDTSPESGLGTLRMYTTLSNILAAAAASLCIPFQIDGLRRDKYKLPYWIVVIMYVGVVGVFLTFSVAITIISITQGFVKAMFVKSNLFLHTINPIFFTILFTLIVSDTKIKFRHSLYAMIPVLIYSFVYFILVFVSKTWRDHYQTNSFMPYYVSFILILAIAFADTQLLRYLHNLTNKSVTKSLETYYLKSPDYEFEKLPQAIEALAKHESKYYFEGDDIYIPVDIIKLLSVRYGAPTHLPLDILYDIYLENHLKNIKPQENN